MTNALPIIKIDGFDWFIDVRLGERRRVDAPFISEPESRELLEFWVEHKIKSLAAAR